MTKEAPEGLAVSLKRAFTWHWHLLGLGAGATVAVLSGAPLLFLPFIAAAELGYLGFLGLNPRLCYFQSLEQYHRYFFQQSELL